MVVTKITKRKRKRPDWAGRLSISVLDLTEDADETDDEEEDDGKEKEDPLTLSPSKEQANETEEEKEESLTFSLSQESSFIKNLCTSTDKTAAEPKCPCPDVEVQRPTVDEPETKIMDCHVIQTNKPMNSLTTHCEGVPEPFPKEILLPVVRMIPDEEVNCLQLRFTGCEIEVRGADDKESPLYHWPLDSISRFGVYYPDDREEEESAVVCVRLHTHFEVPSCSTSLCAEGNDTQLLEVLNLKSKLPDIFALSEVFANIYWQLYKNEVGELEPIQKQNPPTSIPSDSTSTPELEQVIEAFEVLVYPPNDPDAVTITQKDIRMLKPLEFLNDTIIDFYIKYLQQTLVSPEKLDTMHFFNSFFFSKLAETDTSFTQGKAAFERVKKWTRKVEIFEKDFIFIPVNQSFHWSLIIICHPGHIWDVSEINGSTIGEPCILHLDSMEGCHRAMQGHIKNYLLEEWLERNQDSEEDEYAEAFFADLPFIYAKVPQQDNNFDCGLFLLHYVELFLKAAPATFSMKKIRTSESHFLKRSWFKPSEASAKRPLIKKLIIELSQGIILDAFQDVAAQKESSANGDFSGDEELKRLSAMALPDGEPNASDSTYHLCLSSGDTLHQVRKQLVENCAFIESAKPEVYNSSERFEIPGSLGKDVNLQPLNVHRQDEESEHSNDIKDSQSLLSDGYKLSFDHSANEPDSIDDDIFVIEDNSVHPRPPSPPSEESWTFKNCPVPRLSQVIPLQVPRVNAALTEHSQFHSQPSSPVETKSQDVALEARCPSLEKDTGRLQGTLNTSQMSFISLRDETPANALDKNMAADDDLQMFEDGPLDGECRNTTSDTQLVVAVPDVSLLKSPTRPLDPECSPAGHLSPELPHALSDDSKSNDERLFLWLEKDEAIMARKQGLTKTEEAAPPSGRYSELEILGGGSCRLREHTRERRLARSGGKKFKTGGFTLYSSQEVEELSSDDSLDKWDFSGRGKSLETSATPPLVEVGRRVTRSKTQSLQRKELTPKEQARKDALALCKEKVNRRR